MFSKLLNFMNPNKNKVIKDGYIHINPKDMIKHQHIIGSIGNYGTNHEKKLIILNRAVQGKTFTVIDESNDGELDVLIKQAKLNVRIKVLEDGKREVIFNPTD